MSEDEQLLRQYAETRSEQAFSALVSRHIDLVYSAAVRVVGGDIHLAEDVVQTVFTDLSLRAQSHKTCATVPGWLYQHTFFVASTTVRREQRRRRRESEAAQMRNAADNSTPTNWDQMSLILDEALKGLRTSDRNAIVLRYFMGQDLKSIGLALGTNEDAAQKRVARALEKLRAILSERGVTLTGAALAAAMTTHAVTAAPNGMAIHITACILAGTGSGSGSALTLFKFTTWLKTEIAIISGAVVLLAAVSASYLLHTDSRNPRNTGMNGETTEASVVRANDLTATRKNPDHRSPFDWRQVESSDYRQYIANLRAIGCPEETVRDIIIADLNQVYAARMQAIWRRPSRPYWKKREELNPTLDEIKRLDALEEEKAGIVKALFGISISRQALGSIAFLQVSDSESSFLFLPAEKREAARQALRESGIEAKLAKLQGNPHLDPNRKLFAEKLQVLAKVLSPEELDEFRMRNSPIAQWLRGDVEYLNCTPEEFKALLDRREQHLGPGNDTVSVDRLTAIDDVRKLFGEERAQEYERVSDYGYLNGRRAAERAGLSEDLADRAGQILFEARVAAELTATNQALPVLERQREILTLQARAEARLDETLGSHASIGIRKAIRSTLDNTAQFIRP